MEAVKEYAGYVNPHWIAVVATGMYTHLRDICIIGLCFDEENNASFDPSYASMLFTFSVLCLLAEYRLWPRSLKEPPVLLLYIYEMLVAALTTNLATRAVWIPLMSCANCLTKEWSELLFQLNTFMGWSSYSYLTNIAYYMETSCAASHMMFCISLLSFVWMLDATEALDAILDTWAKGPFRDWESWNPCRCRTRRISFADPIVTDWFTYKFMCNRHPSNIDESRIQHNSL